MSGYYSTRLSYRFVSQLDPGQDFKTAQDARAFDRDLAFQRIAGTVCADFAVAVSNASRDSVVALRFWADELADAISERDDLPF